jgi:hypothetical protein
LVWLLGSRRRSIFAFGDAMAARVGLVFGKPACVGTSPLMSDGYLRALRR